MDLDSAAAPAEINAFIPASNNEAAGSEVPLYGIHNDIYHGRGRARRSWLGVAVLSLALLAAVTISTHSKFFKKKNDSPFGISFHIPSKATPSSYAGEDSSFHPNPEGSDSKETADAQSKSITPYLKAQGAGGFPSAWESEGNPDPHAGAFAAIGESTSSSNIRSSSYRYVRQILSSILKNTLLKPTGGTSSTRTAQESFANAFQSESEDIWKRLSPSIEREETDSGDEEDIATATSVSPIQSKKIDSDEEQDTPKLTVLSPSIQSKGRDYDAEGKESSHSAFPPASGPALNDPISVWIAAGVPEEEIFSEKYNRMLDVKEGIQREMERLRRTNFLGGDDDVFY